MLERVLLFQSTPDYIFSMATERILKPSKWFSNKSLHISLHRRKSSSRSSSSNSSKPSSSRSPTSPPCTTTPKNTYSTRDEELREVFRHFDGNGDGKISALELRSYFGSVGEYLSHEEAQGLIQDLDSDGDNLLDFQDFTKLMKSGEDHNGINGGDDHEDDLRKAFEMFVWEKGSGCITPKGLQRMLHRLGDEKSYDECVAMIGAFDIDHNGVLDFNEFHQMMMA